MRKIKKTLLIPLTMVCVSVAAIALSGCGNGAENSSSSETCTTHSYVSEITQEAGCEEVGTATYTCSVCGDSYSSEIPALGHSYVNYVSDGNATCLADGTKTATCENGCGSKDIVTEEGSRSSDHTFKEGACSDCGELYNKGLYLEWTYNDNNPNYYTVAGLGSCKDTEIIIPKTYDGLYVTKIKDDAFRDCANLTSIVIPDSVTYIGLNAFFGCSNLRRIVIPSSVKTIESGAFMDCSSLKDIVIPDSVETIFGNILQGCEGLESITIPFVPENNWESTKKSFSALFGNSTTVPSSLKRVTVTGGTDFYAAFIGCEGLTEIILPDTATNLRDAFRGCSSLTNISLPDSVTDVEGAFVACSSLKTIKIPEGITSLYDTFSKCTNLKSVVLPNSITDLQGTFYGCTGLESFTVPDKVTNLDGTFTHCSSLTSVVIPDSVETIANEPFEYCDSLTIYCEAVSQPSGWNTKWSLVEQAPVQYAPVVWNCKNTDVANDGYVYTVLNGVRYALKDGKATVVRQPGNLSEAEITDTVVYKGSFYSVTGVAASAFGNCKELTSIIISETVKNIDAKAFVYCESLTAVYYKGTATEWSGISIGSYNTYLMDATLYYYSETEPTEDGNYWHYDTDGITPVVWQRA